MFDNHLVAFIDLLGFSKMVEKDCNGPREQVTNFRNIRNTFLSSLEHIQTIPKMKIVQFSDSVVLSAPFAFDFFITFIKAVAYYQKSLFFSNVFMRGGISYGKHFSDSGFMFSQALINAYKLEKDVAVTPRVLIDKNVLDIIYGSNKFPLELPILKESDGIYFVDFLYDAQITNVENTCKHIQNDYNGCDDSIKSKYRWIFDFVVYKFPSLLQYVLPKFS